MRNCMIAWTWWRDEHIGIANLKQSLTFHRQPKHRRAEHQRCFQVALCAHDIFNDERLQASGKPFIIENVMGAKSELKASLMFCASMFRLPMARERLFEIGNTDVFIPPPGPCNHAIAHISVVGHSVWDSWLPGTPRNDGRPRPDSVPVEIGHAAMGISWMSKEELAQAIPPAYTEFIGNQLRATLSQIGAAA